jgi:hypothetical protein
MESNGNGRYIGENLVAGRIKEAWEIPYDSEAAQECLEAGGKDLTWEGPPVLAESESLDEAGQASFEAEIPVNLDALLPDSAEDHWEADIFRSYQSENLPEEFGEIEHPMGDANGEEIFDFELDDELSAEDLLEDSPDPSYQAQIHLMKERTSRKPAEVALIVHRWQEAESARLRGARLKLYECDIGEPGRSDAAAAQNDQFAEFSLDLEPNPELTRYPNKAGISRVSITRAKWDNPGLEKSHRATRRPDLALKLGERSFPLWIPRQDLLEEGEAAELGFVLEDGQGNKVERLSIPSNQTVSVPILNHLQQMLSIPGRFDDPMRDPAIDMDGTLFDVFLKGQNRRAFIARWLEGHLALKEAANEPEADLKTSDIVKAWFVIHDVGVKSSLSDKRFKADQPRTKKGAVHGFLNRAGYYAATHDFTRNRQGTVYEFLSKKGLRYVNGRTINIETVPDIEAGVPDKPDGSHGDPSNVHLYASIGYRRTRGNTVNYYKWTKAAFDVLADLYVFASARARHLLTITVHKEMDRNLGRSVIWREYSAAELRNARDGSFLGKARDNPDDYHGDPYGFNMQALYDLITQKLNALGGQQMPDGARYGIHPRRVCKMDGQDIPNGSHHLHEFPHQSDPTIKADKELKKPGWWNN